MEKKFVALVLIALLGGLGGGCGLGYVIYQPQVQDLEHDLSALTDRFDTTNSNLTNAESDVDNLKTTIAKLQNRLDNIEGFFNETFRVELLRIFEFNHTTGEEEFFTYEYKYGITGHWNTTKILAEPIIEKLNSTLGEIFINFYCGATFLIPFSVEDRGYEFAVYLVVSQRLTETEANNVRLIIQEYLAKP